MSSGRSWPGFERGEVFLRGRVEARFEAAQSERPQARDLGARHDDGAHVGRADHGGGAADAVQHRDLADDRARDRVTDDRAAALHDGLTL